MLGVASIIERKQAPVPHEEPEEPAGGPVERRTTTYFPGRSLLTYLIGSPLSNYEMPHQTISKIVGLAVFASDALSSTAYGPQEMLLVLAAAGTAAFRFAFPLAIGIVVLLIILTLSYEQTIHAYPGGGGAYIVSRDNLGELAAGTAGAALLTDYVLTVAVSISSGVAQLVSAFPWLHVVRVELAVGLVLLVMLVNLRGVRESGVVFAIPTYFFLAMMFLTVGLGILRYVGGTLGTVPNPPTLDFTGAPEAITLFLILRAFSSGTTALTGVEAISNGIPAFREPRSHNAGLTLIAMSAILGVLLLAITFLAVHIGAIPSDQETVISQLARTTFGGRGLLYLATIAGTTVILIMAANTSYADFPRLSALLAQDGFLPQQLGLRGTRLVYSRGIVTLAMLASILVLIFRASVSALIPLYAIGVFLSFTLSQAGMAHRWWKSSRLKPGEERRERGSTLRYEGGWHTKMVINAVGAVASAVVMFVFAATKFQSGAWVIILLIPALVALFFRIHGHYQEVREQVRIDHFDLPPPIQHNRVILPINNVHLGTIAALRYARALSDDVTAVYVATDPTEVEKVRGQWETWGEGVRLVILESPYRLVSQPLLHYIAAVAEMRQPNEAITIVVGQLVPHGWFDTALHGQTANILRLALLFKPGIIVTDVPYQLA